MRSKRRTYGILNCFTLRIIDGFAEGINNKIKARKRQAYGIFDRGSIIEMNSEYSLTIEARRDYV